MHRNPSRPLSPHWQYWRWGPHMIVSILHRVTGAGLAIGGGAVFVWWLAAAASGREAYDYFVGWMTMKWVVLLWIALSWAVIQHTLSGVRHFVMDIGAGYELSTNKRWAILTMIGSIVLTALLWLYILGGR